MRRRLTLLSVLVGLVSLGGAQDALACSCAGGISMKERFRASDGAVVATLDSIEEVNDQRAIHHYTIVAAYKGRRELKAGDPLEIKTATSGAACGLPRQIGKDYGLFLYETRRGWTSNLCSVVSAEKMHRAGQERIGEGKRSPAAAPACSA